MSSADVDYVFTSPVRPREIFAAKVLMNSFTTVLLSFPPVFTLYLKLYLTYGTPILDALLAGLVTLTFFAMGLVLSADVTLSLGSSIANRLKALRNLLIGVIVAVSLLPITLLIPGIPSYIGNLVQVLPSGLAAALSTNLVSGEAWGATASVQLVLLVAWLGVFLFLGLRMSRNHFYEVLQVGEPGATETLSGKLGSGLETEGRSVWAVVRS